MARADVVVVGAGLAGLTAAIELADAGARVEVVARGHAATHWTAGGVDVAAPAGSRTPAAGVAALAARPGHPYAILGEDVPGAVASMRSVLGAEGLTFAGDLDAPLWPVPTAIGGTRRAAIVPVAQAAAVAAWQPDERLVVCGIAGFKDFWPEAIAASLRRASVWEREADAGAAARPSQIEALTVELPGLAGRRNLSGLDLARLFDDPGWRLDALERIAMAVDRAGARRRPGRIGLPAVLGLADHGAAFDDAARILPLAPFEMPLVSPSVPGLRLYVAMRAALRRRGGRLAIGEGVERVVVDGRRIVAITMAAAVRERRIVTDGLVLATGGVAGGGLIGRADGTIEEPLLGLPVEAPPAGEWLAADPFDPQGHPLETAGIRTDRDLRPVDGRGRVVLDNVAVVGSMLAGQRYVAERCGDGVAIASGRRAAATLAAVAGVGRDRARASQPRAERPALQADRPRAGSRR
jgi:glycerol-3-phosphate dehydrogenase subunit B